MKLTFPSLIGNIDKEIFRNEIFGIYANDTLIKILECQAGLRDYTSSCYLPGNIKEQYIEHQKASVYVVSDYLFEKYNGDNESDGNSGNFINKNLIYLFSIYGLMFG